MAASPAVILYGKPDCHLCDEARTVVVAALAERQVELREVDIEGDPDLERRYGELIPVVEIAGEERFRYFVDRDALDRVLDDLERPGGE